jgi:hypothetical protein
MSSQPSERPKLPDLSEAEYTVHWPTGPVRVCDVHRARLERVGRALGVHVGVEDYDGGGVCTNCFNETSARLKAAAEKL